MRRFLIMAVTIAVMLAVTPSLAQSSPTAKDVSLSRKYQMPVNALLTYRTLQASLSIKTKIKPKLDMHIAPTITNDWPKDLLAVLDGGIAYWQGQYFPTETVPTFFFTERDREWLKGALADVGIDSVKTIANFDRNVTINGAGTTWAGSSTENGRVFNLYLNGTEAPAWLNFPMSQVSPHEWTHNAQAEMAGSVGVLPCWYKEGSATFFGTAIAAKTESDYALLRANTVIYQSNPFFGNPPNFLLFNEKSIVGGYEKYFNDRDATYSADKCGPDGSYALGFLATEYLMQLKGKKGQVDFMTLTKSMPWKSAIAKTYRKSWPILVKEIASYIRSSAKLIKPPTDIPRAPEKSTSTPSPVSEGTKPTPQPATSSPTPQPATSSQPAEQDGAPPGAAAIGGLCLDLGTNGFSLKQEPITCANVNGILRWISI